MVNNILIEVLGTIAEQEWKKTKQRREEGIAAMPVVDGKKVSSKTGKGFGRPEIEVIIDRKPDETIEDVCTRLGISRRTYFRKVSSCRA